MIAILYRSYLDIYDQFCQWGEMAASDTYKYKLCACTLLYQYIVEFTLSIKRLSCIEAHQGIINFKEGLAGICIITALTLGPNVTRWAFLDQIVLMLESMLR